MGVAVLATGLPNTHFLAFITAHQNNVFMFIAQNQIRIES